MHEVKDYTTPAFGSDAERAQANALIRQALLAATQGGSR